MTGRVLAVVFASILDHEDPSQQLQDWELENLFDGRGYEDVKMGYMRFLCYGESASNYFKPGSAAEAHWLDEYYTGLSIEDYGEIQLSDRWKYGLMESREFFWFAFRPSHWAASSAQSFDGGR